MNTEEKILEIIEEYRKKTKKDCYFINYVEENPNVFDDKIGGMPYIPIGEEYPKDKYGNPMALLVQINLRRLGLPKYPYGILEIFITTNENDIYRAFNIDSDSFAVKFYEEGLGYQTNLPVINVKDFLYKEPVKIELVKGKMNLPYNMADKKAVNLLLDLFEEKFDVVINYPMEIESKLNIGYYDVIEQLNTNNDYSSNVGGYPSFFNEPYIDYDIKDECIIYLNSDINRGICFGADAGSFYALITKEDLTNKKFDNVTCNFEF